MHLSISTYTDSYLQAEVSRHAHTIWTHVLVPYTCKHVYINRSTSAHTYVAYVYRRPQTNGRAACACTLTHRAHAHPPARPARRLPGRPAWPGPARPITQKARPNVRGRRCEATVHVDHALRGFGSRPTDIDGHRPRLRSCPTIDIEIGGDLGWVVCRVCVWP